MRFLIITHVIHKKSESKIYGYGPYIKEMNLWLKYVDEVKVLAPLGSDKVEPIDLEYKHQRLSLITVAAFKVTSVIETLKTLQKFPIVFYQIIRAMVWAEHIHLRCPGNMGLLGAFAQIIFPKKIKTVKYAGNWDPDSKQPWSYKLQKWLLSNTLLTKNINVLVYGEWPDQSINIHPFFTASYHQAEIESGSKVLPNNDTQMEADGILKSEIICFMYVGALSEGKRPLLSIQAVHQLIKEGIKVYLDIFGEGAERPKLEAYISQYQLEEYITLHGNQNTETVKAYYKQAHFLIFISKSEGWPKVVAEAMFWGCLPITSNVSCVNYMIANGARGKIAEPNVDSIIKWVRYYLKHPDEYLQNSNNAKVWSRQFTLEKFENEIGQLINAN